MRLPGAGMVFSFQREEEARSVPDKGRWVFLVAEV